MSLQVFRDSLARRLAECQQDNSCDRFVDGMEESLKMLNEYIAEQCHPGDSFFSEAIELARWRIAVDEVEGEDLQVDDDAEFSETDTGQWVSAWLFLSNEDIEEFKKSREAKKGAGR